jgi:hypothetical protein
MAIVCLARHRAQFRNDLHLLFVCIRGVAYLRTLCDWIARNRAVEKKALYVFQFLGLIVGLYLLYSHTVSLVTSEIINKSIVYGNSHFFTYGVMMFYFAATTISCFFSSKKIINVFGVSVFIAAAAAMWTYTFSFVSVWCFFAALMSVIVLLYFIKSKAPISFTEN